MRPLVQREFSDKPPWTLSRTLRAALKYVLCMLQNLQPRVLYIRPSARRLVIVASDAQADLATQPSAGAIAICPADRTMFLTFAHYTEQTLGAWYFDKQAREMGKNPIAICECAAVLFSLVQMQHFLRGADIIWFVDNTVALHGLCKGSAGTSALRRTVEAVHILRSRYDVNIWHEYVRSNDNWSDGISRQGWSDPFACELRRRFSTETAELQQELWWYRCDLQQIWNA